MLLWLAKQYNLQALVTAAYKLHLKEMFHKFTQAAPDGDWVAVQGTPKWQPFIKHIATSLFQLRGKVNKVHVFRVLPLLSATLNVVWGWLLYMGVDVSRAMEWIELVARRAAPKSVEATEGTEEVTVHPQPLSQSGCPLLLTGAHALFVAAVCHKELDVVLANPGDNWRL